MRRPVSLLLAGAAALPLAFPNSVAAQSQGSGQAVTPAEPDATAAAGRASALTLRTAERAPLRGLGKLFELPLELPELLAGQHWVAAVDRDRRVTVETATGSVGYLVLEVDPGAVMELFADEIGEVRGLVQGVAVLAMTQQGLKAPQAIEIVKGVFEFPYTLERARVEILNAPGDDGTAADAAAFRANFSVTGKAGTEFGKALQAIAPSPVGAPVLPADLERVMELRLAVAPASLQALLEPFLDFGLSFAYRDEEQRAQAAAMSRDMMADYDGGFVVGFDQTLRMQALYGFRAGASPAELLASDGYYEMVAGQDLGRDMEVEIERRALEHDGVMFTRVSLYNDGPVNPMMPNDEMHQFLGGVQDLMIVAGSADLARALTDRIRAGQVVRQPLEGDAVAILRMDLRRTLSAMKRAIPNLGPAARELPTDVFVQLFVADRTLRMGVTVR